MQNQNEDNAADSLRGSTNLQITLRDNDTMIEVTRGVSIFTANQAEARRVLSKSFADCLAELWPTDTAAELTTPIDTSDLHK